MGYGNRRCNRIISRRDVPMLATLKTAVLVAAVLLPTLISADMIDIETPLDRRTTKSLIDGTVYHLVMSDEFNVDGRSFKDGHDPIWTALDKSDDDASSAGGGSMQFYNSSAVTTENGFLKIGTYLEKTEWNRYDHVNKKWKHEITNFTSGMVQSWNKFCFTGGIVEVDIVFPGEPYIGGLWPAVWMLGNLGRATYEASTNNIWPWSYDTCDRELQQAQVISACNSQNHYGMTPLQGRGATEIDIVEVMTGSSDGALIGTDPAIEYPYSDFTLQVAPGVPKNRPQSGAQPLRENVLSDNGHTEWLAQTWYDDLELEGNTSINPFFYGTYLAETKPFEPVTRSKKQAFQADAIGVVHQLTPAHFKIPHTFRIEWQPGRGGRLDWFVKSHKLNETASMEGDGMGQDWIKAFTIKDKSLEDLMGSQIPIEPSYLIMNTAVSSTWGFPYDVPASCTKCYDCSNPQCVCAFYPGFCKMLESRKTAMLIDSIRIYQSRDDSAHVGQPHTVGCDPPGYPTKEWIAGHTYRYMRNPPFSYTDTGPLRKVQKGGGSCKTDVDCGGDVKTQNLSAIADADASANLWKTRPDVTADIVVSGRGKCTVGLNKGMFSAKIVGRVCSCNAGFTGPNCLSLEHVEHVPSAHEINQKESPFRAIPKFEVPIFMLGTVITMCSVLLVFLVKRVLDEKKSREINELHDKAIFHENAVSRLNVSAGTSI